MIVGIGTDIIEIARIQKLIDEYSEQALLKLFSETEIEYCESFGKRKYEHYAARFAVKEAFSKAIGTGLSNSFVLRDVSVRNVENGRPILELHNGMAERYGHYKSHLTIAHTRDNATAFVVLEEIEKGTK
jgi:holo-[acyl-carrier protein] synthase